MWTSQRVTTPRAVQACHELLAWLIPLLDQFPRSRRFTLGERLENGLLVVLEELVDAAYDRDRRPALLRANRRLAVNRHLWRLALELKVINLKRYEYGAKRMEESKDPTTGALFFIEVKGRWIGKNDITLTKNEILCSRNAPEQFRLALVVVAEEGAQAPRYLRGFGFGEPDFAETTRTFSLPQLLKYAGEPG